MFLIANILWTCFGYFGYVRQCPPKVILSIYRKHLFLSPDKKSDSSSMLFWRLSAFWAITREPEFSQIWDWWWNINNSISFHFRLSPRKTNDKIFKKIQKKYFGNNLGPFAQIWPKLIFVEKRVLLVFKYSNYFFRNIEIFNS